MVVSGLVRLNETIQIHRATKLFTNNNWQKMNGIPTKSLSVLP